MFKIFYFLEHSAIELLMDLQGDSGRANVYIDSIDVKAQPALTNG